MESTNCNQHVCVQVPTEICQHSLWPSMPRACHGMSMLYHLHYTLFNMGWVHVQECLKFTNSLLC